MAGFSEQVVLDTGVFIRLKRIENLGNKFFCTPSVAAEIRDHHARRHVSLLPHSLNVLSPSKECIDFVEKFSALTGDRGFLSSTDIEVIALTLMLQRNTGNVTELRESPLSITTIDNTLEQSQKVHKYTPDELFQNNRNGTRTCSEEKIANASVSDYMNEEGSAANLTSTQLINEYDLQLEDNLVTEETEDQSQSVYIESNSNISSSSDDEGEWITSENLHRFGSHVRENVRMEVACMTTDFSIQNVLLQIGLHILSFDGYRIMSVKLWGLVCRGCQFFERDSSRKFCSRCGNDCVDRVSFIIDHMGQRCLHDNKKRTNLRGTVYSLPKPSRGRKKELILAEDQLMMGGLHRELKHKMKLYETEKAAKNPFNEDATVNQKGWWYRSHLPSGKMAVQGAPKVVIGMGKGNPNSNRWNKRNRNRG
ncbi:Nin one binding (NOB1) Zn-ribbon family protein [Cardiosporidium cionae]|uniref:Nin one binding (NOB1) Zn-ribbon family protein n=1 Tax=Cardiosporidium cionae TaxID=476202 RepID=A0ABQ7JFH7_9APIC|nr:Nin one binding (NOB1) Zn-ribbon family protein [Cardiosporidium cionae]|eukprot:KAF8822629.1 Nin one binding (NOB1) Zn-ribbon family protein [Cardiosporidium cionae]